MSRRSGRFHRFVTRAARHVPDRGGLALYGPAVTMTIRHCVLVVITWVTFAASVGTTPWRALAVSAAVVAYDIGVGLRMRRTNRLPRFVPVGDVVAMALLAWVAPGLAPLFALGVLVAWACVGARMVFHELGLLTARDQLNRVVLGELGAVVWEQISAGSTGLLVSPNVSVLLGHLAESWWDPAFLAAVTHPADTARFTAAVESYGSGGDTEIVLRLRHRDGTERHIESRMTGRGDDGRVRGVWIDVTNRVRAEQAWRRFAEITDQSPAGALVLEFQDPADPSSLVLRFGNRVALEILGLDASAFGPTRLHSALGVDTMTRLLPTMQRLAAGGPPLETRRVSIAERPDRLFDVRADRLSDGTLGITFQDVTDAVVAESRLRDQATHDGLTGLANRVLLRERLDAALLAQAEDGGRVAMLLMDLDGFKEVNDALGHDWGDALLAAVADRLRQEVPPSATVARLGGDEFAVLWTHCPSVEDAERLAQFVRTALESPLEVRGLTLHAGASVGVACSPDHAATAEALLKLADVAMYEAKRTGSGHSVYAPARDPSSVRKVRLLGELREAIDRGELELRFQPAVDLRSGRVTKVEALVRWWHAEEGMVMPGEFIDLAEMSGIIHPLTRWIVSEAATAAAALRDHGSPLRVGANLSVRNLVDTGLVDFVQAMVQSPTFPTGLLELEITEQELMSDQAAAVVALGRLAELGIGAVVDDFGTGYSSLTYLKTLPVTGLKIDRSFVRSMAFDRDDDAIVRSTIELGHRLGLEVTAEGVPDAATLDRLRTLGCDLAQGFWLSEPVPLADLRATVEKLDARLSLARRARVAVPTADR